MRQTGGSAFGDISTKSRLFASALASASLISTIPSWSPSTPISRTCLARISSLMALLPARFGSGRFRRMLILITSSCHWF